MKFFLFILILSLAVLNLPTCNSSISKNKFCDPASESFKFELLYRLYKQDNSAYCFLGARNPAGSVISNPITPPSSAKDITAYSIPSLGITGIITGTEIILIGETYSSFVPEIATFTTTGNTVTIGATPQVSGTTANNFSSTLTYIVTASDSSTKTYTVKFYAPLTISSSNLKAWFKGNSLALANGANVTSWTDSSGTGNTVTTASNYPTFLTSSINGQPAVNFTGIDHNLRRNAGTGLTTTAHSILAVAKPIVGGGQIAILSIGSTACGVDKVLNIDNIGAPYGGMCNVIALGTGTSTIVSNTHNIFAVSYINNATSNLFLNGTLIFSAIPGVTAYANNADIGIGKRIAGTEYFNGQIAEVMYYDINLSTPNIQVLQCYLSKKYAITVTHPCN
jgi:hypothetical protein